jgi:hypothetical protein
VNIETCSTKIAKYYILKNAMKIFAMKVDFTIKKSVFVLGVSKNF